MTNTNNHILVQNKWRIIDQSVVGYHMNPIQSFAIDDLLCDSVGSRLSPPTARIWVHRPTIILGIQDSKLPYLEDGISFLLKKGYPSIIRNSGGLAVVLDEGVLNLTLVFPEVENHLTITRGYEAMATFIKELFTDFEKKIEVGEIVGSYCPGSYDLSIDGKKFAGISQRRLRGGVAVQIYLCITGSGSERARLIQSFYECAKKDEITNIKYPDIHIHVMASLAELLSEELTVENIKMRIVEQLKKYSHQLLFTTLTDKEVTMFEEYNHRIIERNEKVFQCFHRGADNK